MPLLHVVTLNIWNRQGPWDQRLALIQRGLRDLAPDVVGLQEVLFFQGQSQAHAIGAEAGLPHVAFGEAHELGGGVLFGNAVLSRFPITHTASFALPSAETDERRCLLLAKVESPWGPLPFFSTHLAWRLHHGFVREAQVLAIAEHIDREAPASGLPPVLVGDFNADPDATEIRFVKGQQSLAGRSTYFADCHGQTGQTPGITFDDKNPFAAPLQEYPRRIDYVFVRGPDELRRGKPRASRVVFTDNLDGVTASDHYGVSAHIAMGPELPPR